MTELTLKQSLTSSVGNLLELKIFYLAHLCNQNVADCMLLFEIAEIMLDEVTDDSMEALVQVMLAGEQCSPEFRWFQVENTCMK